MSLVVPLAPFPHDQTSEGGGCSLPEIARATNRVAILGGGRIVPLTPELLRGAVLEERDPWTAEMARLPGWDAQFVAPGAIGSALIGKGRVLAAGGLLPQWPGRALAWLMLSPAAPRKARVHAIRVAQRVLHHTWPWRRIEMHVRADEKWALSFGAFMGFELEGRMRAFDCLGRDYLLFARVREDR